MPETVELVPRTSDDVRAMIDAMAPDARAQLSADWLALFEQATAPDPWVHGFVVRHRETGARVGQGGFKGPPRDGANGASKRVLMKCGFEYVGDVVDPEDGLVWRFEKHR